MGSGWMHFTVTTWTSGINTKKPSKTKRTRSHKGRANQKIEYDFILLFAIYNIIQMHKDRYLKRPIAA